MAFIRVIAFEGLEQESSRLGNTGILDENLQNSLNRSFGNTLSISLSDHFSQVTCSYWIDLDNLAKYLKPIWFVLSLLAVWKDFVELVCLNQSLDHLVWSSCCLEDFKSHLRVVLSDQITKCIAHRELLFADPTFNQFVAASLKHGTRQLDGLNFIESCTALQQCREVDHNGLLCCTRSGR